MGTQRFNEGADVSQQGSRAERGPRESQSAKKDDGAASCKNLYPNLSQKAANCAQTVQSEPNGVFGFQGITSEPARNHPFAKPL
jgi:hypothetical protein